MVRGIHRPTVAIIDCLAIYQNIKQEMSRLNEQTELFAVVKADGYGHGALQVAKIAQDAGATGFCVAILDEALELRAAGFQEPILVMGVIAVHDLALVEAENISITVASNEWLDQAEAFYQTTNTTGKIPVHVKIDSGMGRIGYRETEEMQEATERLAKSKAFYLEGLFTHFSTADGSGEAYFEGQQRKFSQALAIFPKNIRYIHTANTATALWHDAWASNMVRFGISVYGSNPSGTLLEAPYPLKEALTLETELVHVKQIHKGDGVGYGAAYIAEDTQWIGTLPMGYADGYRRDYQGFYVLIDGQKAPIVGRVCMDQLMIRLPKAYEIGTKVTLLGKNGDQQITIQELADHGETINYEVTCDISSRVPRIYVNQEYLSNQKSVN